MEMENSNQPVSPFEMPVQSPPVSYPAKNQKGFFPIILGALVLLAVVGVGAYYLGTRNNGSEQKATPNPVSKTSPKEVTKESNENLIIGKCYTNPLCTLKQVSVSGIQTDFQNDYGLSKDSQLFFSKNGNYLVHSVENGIAIVNLKTNSSKDISASKQAKLIRMHRDYFWMEDNGIYKLIDFDGNTKITFDKSLFPRHYPTRDISFLDFSTLYANNKILAMSITQDEGSILRTAWEIAPNEKPKKLFDFNSNIIGSPTIVDVYFFNTEPAFLVVSETETYKLTPTNEKTVLVEDESNIGATEKPYLSPDDTEFYYSKGSVYEQSDIAGLYKYNFKSKSKQQLIKGNNYNPSEQSFHSYHVINVSPSGKNLALIDAVVSGQASTIYTPSIFSLEDLSIKRLSNDSGNIYETREIFGWIDKVR